MTTGGWFVVSKDGAKKQGPYSPLQIVGFCKQGKLKGDDLLSHAETTGGKAVPISSIKQLQPYIAKPVSGELIPQNPEDAIIESGKKAISATWGQIKGIAGSLQPKAVTTTEPPVFYPPINAELKEPTGNTGLANFIADGQDTSMVTKLLDRIQGVCTSEESPLYMAVQQRPVANFSPDAVVLTNLRFMIFRQKVLGRMNFSDYYWRDVKDVHVEENLLGATISFTSLAGPREQVDYLPKAQARKVYRIAQEQEAKAHEYRRALLLEEKRATASQMVINNAIGNVSPNADADSPADPLVKLQKLKKMLDAGLIEQSEYDAKKSELLKNF